MIIGITGTNGSGKGEVANYLVDKKGFNHYSTRALIIQEIQKRGLPVNRDTMNTVSTDMRKTLGGEVFHKILYERAVRDGGDAVIESVREVPGADFLKKHGAFLIAVDANQRERYDRSKKRGSSTDYIEFDTFKMQEEREMQDPDPLKQNVRKVMEMADAFIENNGTMGELHRKVDEALEKFIKPGE